MTGTLLFTIDQHIELLDNGHSQIFICVLCGLFNRNFPIILFDLRLNQLRGSIVDTLDRADDGSCSFHIAPNIFRCDRRRRIPGIRILRHCCNWC